MRRQAGTGNGRIIYELSRTNRQNVLLRVLPGGEVRVYAPGSAHLRDIDRIVLEHAAQIADMRERIDESTRRYNRAHPVDQGACIPVEGVPFPVNVHTSPRVMCRIGENSIELYAPADAGEEARRAAIRSALSRRALERIRQRLMYYAPRIGVQYGRVAIRDQKSRWGSCSSAHNLNFNWKLIMASGEVLDYVVIHELCHLIEFNHSPRFWSLVNSQMRDYEAWKKWLKDHGGELGV